MSSELASLEVLSYHLLGERRYRVLNGWFGVQGGVKGSAPFEGFGSTVHGTSMNGTSRSIPTWSVPATPVGPMPPTAPPTPSPPPPPGALSSLLLNQSAYNVQ